MKRILLSAIIAAALTTVLASCSSDSVDPSTSDLHGIWVSDIDSSTVLVIEMAASDSTHSDLAGLTPVYFISRYSPGTTPAMTQRGEYDVRDGHWVTTPTWDQDPGVVGSSYANEILGFGGGEWVLESTTAPSGRRTFTRQEAYP